MKPYKVLRMTSSIGKGGAGRHVLDIHRALLSSPEFISHLWCPRETLTGDRIINRRLPVAFIACNWLRTKALGFDSIYAPGWNPMMKRIIADFDIIHLHHLQGYYFDIRSLNLLENKNVVLTLHDMWPLTGRCSLTHSCLKWQTLCHHCPQLDVYPGTWVDWSRFLHRRKIELFGALKSLKVVVLSRFAADLLQASHFKDREFVIIPPGINCDDFKPRSRPPKPFITIGVIAAKPDFYLKGIESLLRLLSTVEQKRQRQYRFRLIGHMTSKTQKILTQYSFVDLFPFIGNPRELNSHYNDFDVFLNLSHLETFGKTNIEAQCAGTPVLARNIPPFRENVYYGALYDSDDPEHLLQEIDRLAAHPWDRQLMHQTIRGKFDLTLLGERYVGLYRTFYEGND
ncbi:MAG: glycosyltransferase [Calditrichaeota bacterium]|nr:MAG: glycosyltransferase [Calditrichota bacterium]